MDLKIIWSSEFLWKGKKDPVKLSVLSNDYLEGGLKMTNIDTYIKALQIKWILRLLENSNETGKLYHKSILRI